MSIQSHGASRNPSRQCRGSSVRRHDPSWELGRVLFPRRRTSVSAGLRDWLVRCL